MLFVAVCLLFLLFLVALTAAFGVYDLISQGGCIMSHLDRLTAEVAEVKAAAARAAAKLAEILEKLREQAGDAVAVNALADELDAVGNALNAAADAASEEPAPEPPAPEA